VETKPLVPGAYLGGTTVKVCISQRKRTDKEGPYLWEKFEMKPLVPGDYPGGTRVNVCYACRYTFALTNLYYKLRATFEFAVLYTIQYKCLQYIMMVKRGLKIDTFPSLRT